MTTAMIGGVNLSYWMDGRPDQPVLVLAHSLGSDHAMWDSQMAAWLADFRVLRYDMRGHGASEITPPTDAPFGIDRLGQDVVGLLNHLKIPRAHFCGLSLGGLVGMWLGVNAPGHLERIVLADTAAKIGNPDLWNARVDLVRAGGMAAVLQALLQRSFTPAFLAQASPALDAARRTLLATPPRGYIDACIAIRDADLRSDITRISAPTLMLTGAHDIATPPADGRFIAAAIPGAQYRELDAAHIANIEAPQAFADVVREFLLR